MSIEKQIIHKTIKSTVHHIHINKKATDEYLHIDGIYTAFLGWAKKEFNFEGEFHSFWEMVYVIDGSVGIMSGSNILTLHKGELFFHKPYEFHRIWSADNSAPTYLVISFDLSGNGASLLKDLTLKTSKTELPLLSDIINYILSSNKHEQLSTVYTTHLDMDSEPQFSCFVYTLSLLMAKCSKATARDVRDKSESALIFEQVVKYMENHLDGNPTNDELARSANTSVSTLKRIFREYSELSIHSYFMALRIMRAKKLLHEGLSVLEVSEQLGFSSQNNFSAAFKRMTGISPSRYK